MYDDEQSQSHVTSDHTTKEDWVAQIIARRWQGTLSFLLDVSEPIAPLVAQMMWVGAPVARRWAQGWQGEAWQGITEALESPQARETLRQRLNDNL